MRERSPRKRNTKGVMLTVSQAPEEKEVNIKRKRRAPSGGEPPSKNPTGKAPSIQYLKVTGLTRRITPKRGTKEKRAQLQRARRPPTRGKKPDRPKEKSGEINH